MFKILRLKTKLFFWLRSKLPHLCEACLESKRDQVQFDYLLSHANRKTRRKWWRMMTRCTSPNYIGNRK